MTDETRGMVARLDTAAGYLDLYAETEQAKDVRAAAALLTQQDERITGLAAVCDAHVQADKESAERIALLERTESVELIGLRSRLAAAEARAERAEKDAGRFNELFEKDYTHLYSDYWTQRLNEPNSPPSASEAAFLAAIDAAKEQGNG